MKDDSRNFVLFALFAALILFGWPVITSKFFPAANPPVTKVEDGKSKPLPQPGADPTADSPAALRNRQLVLRETPRVRIDTPTLQGSINLKGARIDDLVLTRYKETVAKNSPPIRLLSPAGAPGAYFAGFGWRAQGIQAPGADTVWQASAPVLAPGRPVTLTAANSTGQRFRIDLAVDSNYMFTVRQTVANAGGGAVVTQPFALVNRSGPSPDPDTWTAHVGPMAVHNGTADYGNNFTDLDEAPARFNTTGGWLGFTDKYWLTALVPDQAKPADFQLRAGPNHSYQADWLSAAPAPVAPGQQSVTTSRFFAGAKEARLLDTYEEAGVPRLGNAIDWGWFQIVEKPIFYFLDWIFRHVGNFGVAIILLTFTFRLAMFPVAQRQFASMAAMRAVQPKMKALQERYKDDKQQLQTKMLELYREEKVNPLAGCAPTLLQIPIFYALYKVLLVSLEMRHQPFIGWIRDLSVPDPLTPVNLFGLLAFTPPHFIAIGVVPIILGITMYFQFKLNPAPMDDMQKQVFAIMPWMMMFLMAPFAVGLQIYWITSNLLTIAQQRFLYSRHPALKTAPAK